MYEELIAELRQHHCDAKEDDTQEVCEECSYDVIIVDKSAPSGFASVCVCGLMNRAADAIEELICEVADEHNARLDAEERRCWIPVSERLPEEYVNVLCHLRSLDRKSEYYSIDHLMEDGQWWKAANSWKYEVTHWMPLPEPPKE